MSDYSTLDRGLHALALASPMRAEMLHDIERSLYLASAPAFQDGHHLIVTGLARAGTTILLRALHQTGAFGSLTYADMPFVLAPNLWARLSPGRQAGETRERAHGDGISVSTESPEALDEVWWRLLSGIPYIKPEGLLCHDAGAEALAGYRDFIRLILRKTGRTRYLSKNNNMLLRLPSLAQAWPGTTFLVPVREPLQQAASLLNQHRRFLEADGFTRKYMTWLGHHEFGATQRHYGFDGMPAGDPMTLDYWLSLWTAAYRSAQRAAVGRPNVVFVVPETLYRTPGAWDALQDRLGLPAGPATEVREVADRDVPPHSPARAEEARALYQTFAAGLTAPAPPT